MLREGNFDVIENPTEPTGFLTATVCSRDYDQNFSIATDRNHRYTLNASAQE